MLSTSLLALITANIVDDAPDQLNGLYHEPAPCSHAQERAQLIYTSPEQPSQSNLAVPQLISDVVGGLGRLSQSEGGQVQEKPGTKREHERAAPYYPATLLASQQGRQNTKKSGPREKLAGATQINKLTLHFFSFSCFTHSRFSLRCLTPLLQHPHESSYFDTINYPLRSLSF
jgi:hypothetical protein